ncbi:MAG: hypothetical protein J6S38_07800, partial [Erysipelotrichaceae bacterium]|nr:hypothetical protein [Erysipelotrichaceae bacterium]
MKKFLTLALALLMALCLVGCGGKKEGGEETNTDTHYDVVFLADLGSIYDGGFNEHSFYGIRDYCE